MRRRLVMSTLAVVVVVLAVIVAPIFVVVSDATDPDDRARLFGRLAIIAAFALVAAGALAAVQAHQLARPLERLARSAGRVGDGDFSTPPGSSGIREIDDIARSLRLSANRVDRMLESERSFTADATHQLRTGLTGIAMRLELLERHPDPEVAAEARATLDQTHDLNAALDELLAVTRRGSTGERAELDLVRLVDEHVADWQERFVRRRRQLIVTTAASEPVMATRGLVGQVINVLLENSLRHGSGTVSVLVSGTSVTVEDEGPGIPDTRAPTLFDRPTDHQAPHGRGLALARRLAQADGGQLELVQPRPPRFRLTLVAAHHATAGRADARDPDRSTPPGSADVDQDEDRGGGS